MNSQDNSTVRSDTATPLKPESEIAFGPYQPEEVRLMILALGKMQDVGMQQIIPAYARFQETQNGWQMQMQRAGSPANYANELKVVHDGMKNALQAMHVIVFQENSRFTDELRSTIEDPKDSSNQITRALAGMINNLEALADVKDDAMIERVLRNDIARIFDAQTIYHPWVYEMLERIKGKTRQLRDSIS